MKLVNRFKKFNPDYYNLVTGIMIIIGLCYLMLGDFRGSTISFLVGYVVFLDKENLQTRKALINLRKQVAFKDK